MKRFLSFLAVSLFVLASCEPDPILSLDKSSLEFSDGESSQTVFVTSNNPWEVTGAMLGSFITVSPMSGVESGYITIKVKANDTGQPRSAQLTVSSSSRKASLTRTLSISQNCPVGEAKLVVDNVTNFDEATHSMSAEGAVISFTVTANGKWDLACAETDVKLDLTTGGAGTFSGKATVPECPVFEGRSVKFRLTCKTSLGGTDNEFSIRQAGGLLTYGGETYHAVKMKDGKWWMAENLRYIPAGMTPSSDLNNVTAGVYYPLVVNADNTGLAFSTDAAVIKAKGYLYQAEVALGMKVGDLTTPEEAEELYGAQGICPQGWHVPTGNDIINLVGKAVSPLATKTDAPYYDGNNGSIALLNADGFNMDAFGAISIQDNTKKAGTFMGWAKGFPTKISSGMFCGSSIAGVTFNTKDDPTSGVKNLQFFGFMPMTNKDAEADYTCNGSKVSYRIAAPLRCVKDN